MSSVGGTTQADASAAAWQGEALSAAEAYAEEQAAQAARERDAAEARAAAEAEAQPRDGIDPPPRPGTDGMFTPTALGSGSTSTRPTGGAGGGSNGGVPFGVPVELDEATVKAYRELELNVTSVGDDKYIINAPYNPSQNVYVTDQAPLEAPDSIPQLPAEVPPPRQETPPAGAGPDPNVDAGAPVESQPAAPSRVETGLGEEVDEIVNLSPSLQKHIEELKAAGWTVQFGKSGVGAIDAKRPIIYIDPSLKDFPDKVAAVLAHEVGHARHPVANVSMEGLTREQYIQRRVEALLDAEGAAALETARYQEEVRARGSELDIAGFHDSTYRDLYQQMKTEKISEQEAVRRAGQVHGDGELHGESKVTYRDHFTQAAQMQWDETHGK